MRSRAAAVSDRPNEVRQGVAQVRSGPVPLLLGEQEFGQGVAAVPLSRHGEVGEESGDLAPPDIDGGAVAHDERESEEQERNHTFFRLFMVPGTTMVGKGGSPRGARERFVKDQTGTI
jgi:hypothetical protein